MAPTAEELRLQKRQAAKEVIDVLEEIAVLLVKLPLSFSPIPQTQPLYSGLSSYRTHVFLITLLFSLPTNLSLSIPSKGVSPPRPPCSPHSPSLLVHLFLRLHRLMFCLASSTANISIQKTNLTRTQLSLSVSLIENGVNPEALAVCSPPFLPTHPRFPHLSPSHALRTTSLLHALYTSVPLHTPCVSPPSRHTPPLFPSSNSPMALHNGSVDVATLTARRSRPSSKNSGKSAKRLASSTQTAGILRSEGEIAGGRWQGKPGGGWGLGSLRAGREGRPIFSLFFCVRYPSRLCTRDSLPQCG